MIKWLRELWCYATYAIRHDRACPGGVCLGQYRWTTSGVKAELDAACRSCHRYCKIPKGR